MRLEPWCRAMLASGMRGRLSTKSLLSKPEKATVDKSDAVPSGILNTRPRLQLGLIRSDDTCRASGDHVASLSFRVDRESVFETDLAGIIYEQPRLLHRIIGKLF